MVHLIKEEKMNIGIDIGYSRIKVVLINDGKLLFSKAVFHKGKINNSLELLLKEIDTQTGSTENIYGITGLFTENETECLLHGYNFLDIDYGSILEIGARKAIFFNNVNNLHKLEILTNSGCSAGTGSFFEEQASRLDIKMNDLSKGEISEDMPKIAGRCSVFARTDIIHHQQEGRDINQILGGLSMAVAKSLKAHLIKSKKPALPLLLTGGLTLNRCFISCLESVLKIPKESIIIDDSSHFIGAIGAAGTGEEKCSFDKILNSINSRSLEKKVVNKYPPLNLFGTNDHIGKHKLHNYTGGDLFLGVDIGSTSINLVLIDKNSNVIKLLYLRNSGKPVENVLSGIKSMEDELGLPLLDIPTCITGSGRKYIAEKLGKTLTRDEITAQARGCLYSLKDVDTILEIGGQDSKLIKINNSNVDKFKMNKVCAAGTGAFLEEQASQFGISLDDFVKKSLMSETPALMNERCTVFIEGVRSQLLAQGRSVEDICAGLCYAVVQNYLQRVAGNTNLGEKIVLQGGIAYNQGVVNGFRSITGKEIVVPDYFSVTGALGSALIAMESLEGAKKITNHKKDNFFETQFLKGYDGIMNPGRRSVGIPRVLFIHKLFPLFHQFFKALNFDVILSDMNNPEIITLSQENSFVETCYPIKIAHGHVKLLINKKPDFIFIPSLITMKHEGSKARKDCACIFMQTLGVIMDGVFDFNKEGIKLLNPELNLEEGVRGILRSLKDTGKELGIPKILIIRAIFLGFRRFISFKKTLMKRGKSLINNIKDSTDPVFVIITRPYGVMDPVLNKGIMMEVRNQGYRAITLESLPVEDYGLEDHPHMSWPFGQHILNGVEIVKNSDNLQLIYLTNHGCGPDSVLSHYVEDKMKGKPYLNIEIDEHSSATGIKTRIEAFVNCLKTRDLSEPKIFIPNIYPFNRLIQSSFSDLNIATPTSEAPGSEVEEGKEYATLSCLLNEMLNSINKDSTIIIPRNEGSEVDGQYASFIIKKLRRTGFKDVKLRAPYLEDIPNMNSSNFKKIWDSILLHDILNIQRNDKLLPDVIKNIDKPDIIVKTAYSVLEDLELDRRTLLLVGDPYILFHENWIVNDIEKPVKARGFQLLKTPLSEMLYLLWARNSKNNIDNANMLYAISSLTEVAQIFGKKGSFTLDMNSLVEESKVDIGMAQGGFIEYIYTKMKLEESRYCGIIRVSSMYDNSAMVTSLKENRLTTPKVHIEYNSSKKPTNISDLNNMICIIENRTKQPVNQKG